MSYNLPYTLRVARPEGYSRSSVLSLQEARLSSIRTLDSRAFLLGHGWIPRPIVGVIDVGADWQHKDPFSRADASAA